MSKRSPILGYNHNIGHRGLVFHVQTEDSGVDNPHIFTHLFHGGVIIFTRKIDYDAAADESLVKSLMQAQHKAMLKELKRGIFDERIDVFLGDHPELVPRKARDTIPDSPAASRLLSEPTDDEYAAVSITEAPAEDASATAEMAVIAGDEWTPSEITSSEVSDVFRIIMQPSLDAQDDSDPNRANRQPEFRIESLKPGAASNRRIQRETVEIHSTPPSDEPPELELHSAIPAPRARTAPPPPASPHRPAQRAPTPSSHVSPRAEGNVLVSRPPIRVDSHSPAHSAHSAAHSQAARRAPPPPPGASRPMAPRTVREDPLDSLFDQQAISEKSLDEVILAYLSEDASKDEP